MKGQWCNRADRTCQEDSGCGNCEIYLNRNHVSLACGSESGSSPDKLVDASMLLLTLAHHGKAADFFVTNTTILPTPAADYDYLLQAQEARRMGDSGTHRYSEIHTESRQAFSPPHLCVIFSIPRVFLSAFANYFLRLSQDDMRFSPMSVKTISGESQPS